jgi:hypothetical protein
MRKRSQIRGAQRSAVKDAKRRLKLAMLEEGGSPERPIRVSSASVVEPHVESMPCVVCGQKVRIDAHDARDQNGIVLRSVHVKCTQCGVARTVYVVATQFVN